MHSRLRRPRGLYRLNRSFNFTSNEKEPITRRFLSGYRLRLYYILPKLVVILPITCYHIVEIQQTWRLKSWSILPILPMTAEYRPFRNTFAARANSPRVLPRRLARLTKRAPPGCCMTSANTAPHSSSGSAEAPCPLTTPLPVRRKHVTAGTCLRRLPSPGTTAVYPTAATLMMQPTIRPSKAV